jgi:quercetin dioxygenase-like cupin family protein
MGWETRFVEVSYPPGSASAAHRHPGFVLGYVIEGEFRFAINGESPRDLGSGQAFYEPPGALHSVSANALPGQPAKILAIIIAQREKE